MVFYVLGVLVLRSYLAHCHSSVSGISKRGDCFHSFHHPRSLWSPGYKISEDDQSPRGVPASASVSLNLRGWVSAVLPRLQGQREPHYSKSFPYALS